MKTLLLVTGGRGGSDFFQGLLDGHSQILQFPVELSINKDFQEMISLDAPDQISKRFINLYPHCFDSRIGFGRFERHNRLGKNRNKFYKVDKKKFVKNFSKLMNKKNFFFTFFLTFG